MIFHKKIRKNVEGLSFCIGKRGGVKTERVFPGLSVLRKNNNLEVLFPEK